MSMVNLLAGDVGGTNTRLGLFEKTSSRPRPLAVREFATLDFPDLPAMISAFLHAEGRSDATVESACFGVAGPIVGEVAELTNTPWRVDAAAAARALKLRSSRVRLLNDLEAMAYGVPVLHDSEVHVLQAGRAPTTYVDRIGNADNTGHIAVIAAGTGLGEALLHRVDGRFVALASEAGHADFAARTDRDISLLRHLVARYGRAQVEHVISGPGLVNIHRVSHTGPCVAAVDLDDPAAPAAISAAALSSRCQGCVDALGLFVDAYGAEAGNLALRTMATGGVFIGGGIAPKILPALTTGAFLRAFRAKAPFEAMLEAVPVKIILNADAGLLGAASFCSNA
jgi:glucokinase